MQYYNLHTHSFSNSDSVVELVNQYPSDFSTAIPIYSIGIHPWHINKDAIEQELAFIERQLSDNKCFAIGECGLDKRIEIDFNLQLSVFEKQLILAEAFKKPVIIHCVGAFQEVILLKNRLKISVPLVIHGYSKNEILAKQLIENNFYLSFGKYLLRNPELEHVLKTIPLERLFLETDTMEESIAEVYLKAANAFNISIEEMQMQMHQNFKKVFTK